MSKTIIAPNGIKFVIDEKQTKKIDAIQSIVNRAEDKKKRQNEAFEKLKTESWLRTRERYEKLLSIQEEKDAEKIIKDKEKQKNSEKKVNFEEKTIDP